MSEYNPFITAISRKKMSKPMRELVKAGTLENKKVLDYGCGRGEDVRQLNKQGIETYGYDKYSQDYNNPVQEKFDVVTCHYVFNVIPNLDEHKTLIDTLRSLAEEVYITVRSDIEVVTTPPWKRDEDSRGFWSTRGTFQRFYDEHTVRELFGDVQIINSNKSFILFKLGRRQ